MLCLNCWTNIDQFHKYFIRIQNIHKDPFEKILNADENKSFPKCNEETIHPKTMDTESIDLQKLDTDSYCNAVLADCYTQSNNVQPMDAQLSDTDDTMSEVFAEPMENNGEGDDGSVYV